MPKVMNISSKRILNYSDRNELCTFDALNEKQHEQKIQVFIRVFLFSLEKKYKQYFLQLYRRCNV